MKILEISDRGIKILEDGEIINQGLFQDEKDIPREIEELLAIYEISDEVVLKTKITLDEEVIFQIKEIIIKKGWILKESNTVSKKVKIVFLTIIAIEFILGLAIYLKVHEVDRENIALKKETLSYKKSLKELDSELSENHLESNEELEFKRTEIGDNLVFLSKACKKSDIYLEKIEFLKNKIILNGSGKSIDNILSLKKFISMDRKIIESKFDFIKKEGEILYFLLELEID